MSNQPSPLHYRFDSLYGLVRFFRLVLQPESGDAWGKHYEFHATERKKASGSGRRSGWDVYLTLFDQRKEDEPSRCKLWAILEQSRATQVEKVPSAAGECLSLADLLERLPLDHQPPRPASRDLLVALYGEDREEWSKVYASAPKAPDSDNAVIFLDTSGSANVKRPSCLIVLRQADPKYDWSLWLAQANRRCRGNDGHPQVQLFYCLDSDFGDDRYFVEWNWRYPLEELGELYPNRHGSRFVLIAGPTRDEPCRARWIHIHPRLGDSHLTIKEPPDRDPVPVHGLSRPVEVHIDEEEVETSEGHEVMSPPGSEQEKKKPPLVLHPRLISVHESRQAKLPLLDRRIQSLKHQVYSLEQQRLALLARQQERLHYVLLFRQISANPATAELPNRFQRFLESIRARSSEFDYGYCEERRGESTCRWHVLITQNPVDSADLQTGLADKVFFQPESWGTRLYVRDGQQLQPLPDRNLAEKLRTALGGEDLDGQEYVLVEPGEKAKLRVSSLKISDPISLHANLVFLNAAQESACWADVRRELLDERKPPRVDLNAEVQAIEEEIGKEVERRLESVKRSWKEFAEESDRVTRHLQHCQDGAVDMAEISREFARSWRVFVDTVLAWNDDLVASKLNSLRSLERERKEWHDILNNVDRSNIDIRKQLDEMERQIGERLRDGRDLHAKAQGRFCDVQDVCEGTRLDLSHLLRQVEERVRQADEIRTEIEGMDRELAERQSTLTGSLLPMLRALRGRLEEGLGSFADKIEQVEQRAHSVDALVDTIDKQEGKLTKLRDDWQDAVTAARGQLKPLRDEAEGTVLEIEALKTDLEGRLEQGRQIESGIDRINKDLKARTNQLTQNLLTNLRQKHDILSQRRLDFESEASELRDECTAFNDTIDGVREAHRKLDRYRSEWQRQRPAAEQEASKLEDDCDRMVDEMESIQEQLREQRRKATDLEMDLLARQERIDRQEQEIRDKISAARNHVDRQRKERDSLRELERDLQSMNGELSDALAKKEELTEDVRAAITALTQTLEDIDEQRLRRGKTLVGRLKKIAEDLQALKQLDELIRQTADFQEVLARDSKVAERYRDLMNQDKPEEPQS